MSAIDNMSDRKQLVIGKPYILECDNRKVRLCSDITLDETRTLYYEVDKEYRQYLCDDRADPFLIGLLHTAMYDDVDIKSEEVVSEQLLFQLRMYYIPTLSDNMSDMNPIGLIAEPIKEKIKNCNGVGTGNSGGVDSLYTMLKYNNMNLGSYKLTHVMFNNISTEDYDDERIRSLFERDCVEKKKVAEEFQLKFIGLYTNLYSFYRHPGIFNQYFAPQYVSAAYALGELFSVYYFSSTFPVNMFSIDQKVIISSARFDIFTLDCISTSSLKIYSAGTEVDRMGKMDYIMGNDLVQRHLQVCAIEQSSGGYERNKKLNCGHCHKCSRTISILYAHGLLEKYEGIIDLTQFNANKAKFIGRGLAADQRSFSILVRRLLKQAGVMPRGTGLWYRLYRIRYTIAKNEKLVKMYHKIKNANCNSKLQ